MNRPSIFTTFSLIALTLVLVVHAVEMVRMQHDIVRIQQLIKK